MGSGAEPRSEPEYAGLPLAEAAASLLRDGRLEAAPASDGRLLFSRDPYPQKQVDLRASGGTFAVIDQSGGSERVVGSISGFRAYVEGHEGAVYLHRGQSYLVERLDAERRNVHVRPADVPYYTEALFEKHTEILDVQRSAPLGNVVARLGRLRVTTRIYAFQKRRVRGQELLSTHPLELPPHVLETVGLWWEIDDELARAVSGPGQPVMGSLHATEHCAIGLLPLFALCDRLDVAGICYAQHPQLRKAAIFVYDGYQGGVGLAARAFALGDALLRETARAIDGCPCEDGCPSCIQSPRCGSGNKPLDKRGALELIRLMIDEQPLVPRALPAAAEPEPAPLEVLPAAEPPAPPPARIVVVDVETQRSAEEVGGWHNAHLMRVAIAVAYDAAEDRYHVYREGELDGLFRLLEEADLVVGFNIVKFDYNVLRAYAARDLRRLPTLDLLLDVMDALGRRVSLDALCSTNLGAHKTADGLQSLRWWREGRVDEIVHYCKADVELTWRLFELGRRAGEILAPARGGGKPVPVPVRWAVPEVLERLAAACR